MTALATGTLDGPSEGGRPALHRAARRAGVKGKDGGSARSCHSPLAGESRKASSPFSVGGPPTQASVLPTFETWPPPAFPQPSCERTFLSLPPRGGVEKSVFAFLGGG